MDFFSNVFAWKPSATENTSNRKKTLFPEIEPTASPFIESCRAGDFITVGTMLSEGSVDPSESENLALKIALSQRQFSIVSLLLRDKRVDPSLQNNRTFKV